jgi:hypothetical protein
MTLVSAKAPTSPSTSPAISIVSALRNTCESTSRERARNPMQMPFPDAGRKTVSEQLRNQAAATSDESGSNSHFRPARGSLGEQQICD